MNPSTHVLAGRKGQRIELEVRVIETPMANGGAHGIDEQNRTNQVEPQEQNHSRVAMAQEVRNHAEEKW